jgi:hypothetical protein
LSLCSRRFGGALSALYRRPRLSHCGAPKAKPRQSTQRYAIADYTKAIEINPRYVEAYNSRSNAFEATGDLEIGPSRITEMRSRLARIKPCRQRSKCPRAP